MRPPTHSALFKVAFACRQISDDMMLIDKPADLPCVNSGLHAELVEEMVVLCAKKVMCNSDALPVQSTGAGQHGGGGAV